MRVISLNAAEIKCHVHQSTAAHHGTPWTNLVVIWSWLGHDLVMDHFQPPRVSLHSVVWRLQLHQHILSQPPQATTVTHSVTDFTWLFLTEHFGSLRILLCSLHMLTSNNTKVSPAGWSVHWLHAENVGWNTKFQTLTSQQSRLKQPQHVPVILKLCANQTSWFRPWHATRNVVSLVATESRTDPPRAHLQLSSWFHTFVDLATHILTTRMTAKETPIKGWLLSFVLLSWHASLILYSWHHRQWHARKLNKREPNDGWDRVVPTGLAFTAPFSAPSSSMSFKAFWTCSCTEIWCSRSTWIWCGCDQRADPHIIKSDFGVTFDSQTKHHVCLSSAQA